MTTAATRIMHTTLHIPSAFTIAPEASFVAAAGFAGAGSEVTAAISSTLTILLSVTLLANLEVDAVNTRLEVSEVL